MPLNQHAIASVNNAAFTNRHRFSHEPDVFTHIYQHGINMAVWQRACQPALDLCAAEWINRYPSHTPKLLLPVDTAESSLASMLPSIKHVDELQQDITQLIELVSLLFECESIGVRLAPLISTMCPRFHIDNIPCRLVVTYGGPGTEWLTEDNVNRDVFTKEPALRGDETGYYIDVHRIQRMASQQVALLKGSGWEGNENFGLVHRSPQLLPSEHRLLLTLDF